MNQKNSIYCRGHHRSSDYGRIGARGGKLALQNFHEYEIDNKYNFDFSGRRFKYYPHGWDENCMPYNTENARTLGEILENDEEYQKKLKELREIREKYSK